MRSICLLFLVAACVAEDLPEEEPTEGVVQSAVTAGPHNLRIATFNIHYGIRVNPDLRVNGKNLPGYDLPYDNLAMVASQIRAANADVVLLQEVSNHYEPGGCDDQPSRLIQLLGDIYPYRDYAPDYAQARASCGWFWSVTNGQMILSKLPLNNPTNTPLEPQYGTYGYTHVQSARVFKDGVAFQLYNTHFSTVEQENIWEFINLRYHIDATAGNAVVLAAGDFNWNIWSDPQRQSPMTSRPLYHHGNGIDHLWTDWPFQNTEGSFPMTSPISASDHPMMWWDLSWVGDNWVSVGQKAASGFGMNSAATSSSYIYGRNGSTPVRARKTTLTEPWLPDSRLGNPIGTDVTGNYRATSIPNDPYGCELVGWRENTFKWAFGMGASCELSQPVTTPYTLGSAPAINAFTRWYFLFGSVWTFYDYFVFAVDGSGALAWSHYDGGAPTPPSNAFSTWNLHTDGVVAKAGSAPATITPGALFGAGGCTQVFIRDTSNRLYTKSLCYNGTYTWSPWRDLGQPDWGVTVASNPAAANAGFAGMHACIVGSDRNVYCRSYTDNAWENNYRACGAPPGGAVGDPVVAMEGNDLMVYIRGERDRIFVRRCNR